MGYLLTNQNNFAHLPYPSPSAPKATVKSGGCGACAALMIVENMTDERYKMADWVDWVIATGARVSGGTRMSTLGKALAAKFGLTYSTTSSETALADHLRAGGMAIANVGGERDGWLGLLSSAGHFVAVLGIAEDGRFIIGDPGIYPGKYNTAWRSARVEVDRQLVYISAKNLNLDTKARTPNYYLFGRDDEVNQEQFNAMMENYLTARSKQEPATWSAEARSWAENAGLIQGAENGDKQYKGFVTREQLMVFLRRFTELDR